MTDRGSAAWYLCSGHHGQDCGHTASNHGALGCTACGCKHSQAFVMYQWALHELEALQDRLEDWERAAQKVMAEQCAPDEKHCACVPFLRTRLEAAEKENATHRDHLTKLQEVRIYGSGTAGPISHDGEGR